MTYGVVKTGFARKPLSVILDELQTSMVSVFGPQIVQTEQSPLGQLNGLMADLLTETWEFGEDVYQSYDPDAAEGNRLEILGKLRLVRRMLGEEDASFRQAITNAGQARIDMQDLARAVASLPGVTYSQVFVNDSARVDDNAMAPNSVAVAVLGGNDDEVAGTIRAYVVPGIGTWGNVRIDTTIDGFCRSIYLIRPVLVPIKLDITVTTHIDRMGCPPPSMDTIKTGLVTALAGDHQLVNGQDVTVHAIRSVIESLYPNVEVRTVLGSRVGSVPAFLPLGIRFEELPTFAFVDITITPVAP